MRADMDKVLVESPRSGRRFAEAVKGQRRRRREQLDPDGEGGPRHQGMRRDGVKRFGEHLGPLYRYLRAQVNRPWDKVYGELCAQLDRRSVVQQHLFEHLHDRVAVDTVWIDGQVWWRGRWRALTPLRESRVELYVHPRTGLLLLNRGRLAAAQQARRAPNARRGRTPIAAAACPAWPPTASGTASTASGTR